MEHRRNLPADGYRGRGGYGRARGGYRPLGLRGREIGLHYRNQRTEYNGMRLAPSVTVSRRVLARVDDCLQRFEQQTADELRVCTEFEERFRHALSVDFEQFIAESRDPGNEQLAMNPMLNERFQREHAAKQTCPDFLQRQRQRLELPAMQQSAQILDAIAEHQVVLLVGSTGCGKTTQVPQLLLDEFIRDGMGSQCRIVCTQPRRISAISVADRVAYERFERLGSSVGYQIRLESVMPREHGSILYCTTGILLQTMQTNPLMQGLSAVILDEIHERSSETDLLMALLKQILPHRRDLKVILMSATVDEHEFCEYFNSCYMLRIEGTLYPVDEHYLEDVLQETGYNRFEINSRMPSRVRGHGGNQRPNGHNIHDYSIFIESYVRQIRHEYPTNVIQALRCVDSEGANLNFLEFLIFYICDNKPPGAILVFLPGYDKIKKLHSMLELPKSRLGLRLRHFIEVHPLHSLMPTANQQNIFMPPPPGKRKIILSTIMAETSVTIEDVVYVINTGRTKIKSYDVQANIETLDEVWVTHANSEQRKGRAGRVQAGVCYHLFTRARHSLMDEKPTPEIARCKLESIILDLKLLHVEDVFEFMQTLITPPNPTAIQNGIKLLQRIGALEERSLTPLGMHLARLPVDPQMGKMILMAALFRCVDPITSVAAALSYRTPFFTPLGGEQKVDRIKLEMAENMRSDHLLINNCILRFRTEQSRGSERHFCTTHCLSSSTLHQLEDMKRQFTQFLHGSRFLDSSDCRNGASNENSNNIHLLRAIIAAGLYPNMAHLRKVRNVNRRVEAIHTMSTPEESRINFHPSSVNSGGAVFDSKYFVYFQKQKSTDLFILDSTMVYPTALIIFGDYVDTGVTNDNETYISVANSYFFKCDQITSNIMLRLRRRLEWLMQKKALHPAPIAPNSGEECLIKAIQILLSMDDDD